MVDDKGHGQAVMEQFALLQQDVVLHAAALRNLVDDLQRIKLERNVDLLSCFSGDDKA